jgi:chorismate mutase/GNAT superfamily N-acetyltransferase
VRPTDELDLTLRPAEPQDATPLADLYSAARVAAVPMMPPAMHTNAEDRAWFAAQLAAPGREVWVAERGGGTVGYALLHDDWLDHLFIRPDVVGQGVGSALLDLVKSVRPGGFCLWVFESNQGARRFYLRHGLVHLERTDGAGNEERAPDLRMAWPGADPLTFFRGLIDDVDEQLGDLLARRAALTAAVQRHKSERARDPDRERAIAVAMSRRAPALGTDRLTRIMHTIITESLDAADS